MMNQERKQLTSSLLCTLNIEVGDLEESCPELIQEFDEILDQYINQAIKDSKYDK